MIDERTNDIKGYFSRNVNKEQSKDAGMALVLIFLLLSFFLQANFLLPIAIVVLIIDMVFPDLYRPFARFWIGMSYLLGTIASKIILTLIFFILVIPMGTIRRLIKIDNLKINQWKKDTTSVFRVRNHIFQSEEIEKPY